MIASILGGIAASSWTGAALRFGAIALTIFLFLLSIRRTSERVGRLAEHLETRERTHETQRRMQEARLAVLVIATSWLTGCAMTVTFAAFLILHLAGITSGRSAC